MNTLFQAPDSCWNAPLKSKIRQQYNDWMMHGEKSTTASNTRAPPTNIYLNRIVEAWNNIPNECIAKSFKACDITNAVHGSEDEEIHCSRKMELFQQDAFFCNKPVCRNKPKIWSIFSKGLICSKTKKMVT
uniref:DDE-1 domain-containing protein n=1 Tax=Acrobeloides nanus TaxID=290746 RepID=A0A914DXT8_9BILA